MIYQKDKKVEGLLLLNHGIFTFGNTARESYERMIRNDSLMKTFTKHMRGAFVVRLGRLNAELKRRG